MFRRLEAEACAKAGDLEAGLHAIEEALAVSKETGGNLGAHRWNLPCPRRASDPYGGTPSMIAAASAP